MNNIQIEMATHTDGPLKVYPLEAATTEEETPPPSSFDDSCGCDQSSCESSTSTEPMMYYSAQSRLLEEDTPSPSPTTPLSPLAEDIVRTMCCQEATVYHHPISYYVNNNNHKCVKESRRKHLETMDSWRSSLIRWMYQVVDFSHVKRETVGVAIYFLDVAITEIIVRAMNRNQKFCGAGCNNNKNKNCLDDYKVSFQLAAATALQLAIKTHDCKIIKLQDLITLGRNVFTQRDIITMEVQIIQACGWYLHPPSVYCYLQQYQSLLLEILQQEQQDESSQASSTLQDTMKTMSKLVNLITEIVSPQAQYKNYPPSIVAYAIMLVAMAFCNPTVISPSQRQQLSHQLSSALCGSLEQQQQDSQTQQQQEQQQDVLLQVIREVQASCLEASQLDCAALLQDMVILESASVLVCVAMDDNDNDHDDDCCAPKTPTKGSSASSCFSIIAATTVHSSSSSLDNKNSKNPTSTSPESPISVVDSSSQLQVQVQVLAQQQQQQ
eukprot:CAMPEP_0113650390 /NCGR_PEP_ID=MMETSP0017_2-20120614/26813_1 /TAXON_ID=2856 /ORGANISM="Cylindrotheca closterium" /LENGTH=495 /DNA_ID=CAMNT_0000562899 /DNA_START=222 /DNA_END=1709 /DNA_ORIENTATION=+ /assembly_acc=CAM_ASM_000147